ncbi:hypothetical protein G9A89_001536 [Geosiphon pyriformis]|nr:hypothetical protein G9A89_001536 [Geosiphon pyriformis]
MTQFTLFKLVYGRKAMLLIEQVIPLYPTETINEENFETTLHQRTYQLMEMLENNQRTTVNNISHTQERQKERHDKHLSEQPMEFKIGDQVLLHRTKAEKQWSGKFDPKWDVAHGNRLKIYHVKQESLSSVPQLRTQISLIRPEDIPQDLEPIIRYGTKIRAEKGKMRVQLELNVLFSTHHPKDNVGEKIAFGQEVEKKEAKNKKKFEEIKEVLVHKTELPETGEWTPDNAQE